MMQPYVRYHDIPKERLRDLRKQAVRRDKAIRWRSAFSCGFAVFVGSCIAGAMFSDPQDRMGQLVVGIILSAGLTIVFWSALVEPRVRCAVERESNAQHESIEVTR